MRSRSLIFCAHDGDWQAASDRHDAMTQMTQMTQGFLAGLSAECSPGFVFQDEATQIT